MKRAAGRILFLALLPPLALGGCGRHQSAGDSFAGTVADAVQADCLQVQRARGAAPKGAQLCACTADKIRASGIKASDGDKANDEKIHAAQQACRRQILGD